MTHAPWSWGGPPPAPQPGVIPLRPLGVGDILRGVLGTVTRNWKAVYGVTLAVTGGMLLVAAAAVGLPLLYFWDALAALDDTAGGLPGDEMAGLVVTGAVVLLVLICAGMYALSALSACYTVTVSHAALGRRLTLGEMWRWARPRVGAVMGVQVLASLMLAVPVVLAYGSMIWLVVSAASGRPGGGFVAALLVCVLLFVATVIAALFFSVRFAFAAPAATLERQPALASLRRSWRLTHGSWWRILGVSVLVSMLAAVVNQVVQYAAALVGVLGAMAAVGPTGDAPSVGGLVAVAVVVVLLAVLGSTVTMPFTYVATALLYVDQRIRRESLDLALAEAAGLPPHRPVV